ncbi:potassium transporter TrkG [Myroides sp. JBRI-B21084]|uniref:TrkH family potassium uptake protein n=1 Tax=Myroides sp. JBRI-B21084 TaxID=3119977 RepID=UPI0026E36918|nr:potassium transporter TrkG [Paenimyroides cloacae]WKW45655.1 potassium transporter TrkG [Paenimyroides cloacae]
MKKILTAKWPQKLIVLLHFLALISLIFDYGFSLYPFAIKSIVTLYFTVLFLGVSFTVLKYIYHKKEFILGVFIFDLLSFGFVAFCVFKQISLHSLTDISHWLRLAIILKLITEFTRARISYKRSLLNPAQLFILSFMLLILSGALLLMLPKATTHGITFIDALFTSTSAVCVTGLIVVDTSSYFTFFGKTIIMILIQAGGLGILTFASYFSYFFKGGSSYENQLALSDMTNSDKIGEVFTTVKRILVITFFIETIGALLIYLNLDKAILPSISDRIYFSVFHSISAFCNAGFSTLPNNLMQEGYVYNYPLQFIIILIFVFGGLGFPIVINSLKYLKHILIRHILKFAKRTYNYRPWILTLSNKINLNTTLILIILGTSIIYIKEYYNVLQGHSTIGKFITALFTATTPRTAGFNSIDFSQLHFSSIIIIILLMWIGASPASTGGGIKTSTFAIATLNYLSLAKGKTKIEIFRREIADISVRRAFAVMSLSLVIIGISIMLIAHFNDNVPLLDIAFETFSAYSTSGLSLGITGSLTNQSKLVLIATMFIGRVSMLTILIAFFKRMKQPNYHYPADEILIN